MERRLLAFSTLKLAQPTESVNAEKEVLMKWVTVLGSRMGEIYMQVVHKCLATSDELDRDEESATSFYADTV
jgi:hypothetical protein